MSSILSWFSYLLNDNVPSWCLITIKKRRVKKDDHWSLFIKEINRMSWRWYCANLGSTQKLATWCLIKSIRFCLHIFLDLLHEKGGKCYFFFILFNVWKNLQINTNAHEIIKKTKKKNMLISQLLASHIFWKWGVS